MLALPGEALATALACAKGWVALVWNPQRKDTTPFLKAYERLLEVYRTDRREVEFWRKSDETAQAFFGPSAF